MERMKKVSERMKSGNLDASEEDPFELFVAATSIRYCYYHETHTVLGNTYGMCVLQDFEALTPNLLARTLETVEGGGLIAILLGSLHSLKQLYALAMDVHARYRTQSHQHVVGRFNERFLLSVAGCDRALVLDDALNVLPLTSQATLRVERVPPRPLDAGLSPEETRLAALLESLRETQPVGCLVAACRTLDQAQALLTFAEAVAEKSLRSTVALTAARGRGKSAALGLAMAAAVAFGYCNVFVTSPSPENLRTLFEFIHLRNCQIFILSKRCF
jgi:N-acetyltransferase 10